MRGYLFLRWFALSAIALSAGFPQGQAQTAAEKREDLDREQDRAAYEYRQTERARDQFYQRNVPGHERRDRTFGRLYRRYSRETKPSFESITNLAAPKEARRAYRKALRALDREPPEYDGAMNSVMEALELYRDYAAAWVLLGRIQLHRGNREEAAAGFQRSIEIDPKYLAPYPDLAYLTVAEKKWPEVIRLGDEMIKINPYFTLGYYYRGLGFLQQDQLKTAEKALLVALATPDIALFPDVHYMLGEVYRQQGSYRLAAREYRLYLAAMPGGFWSERVTRRLQEWETLGVIRTRSTNR
ncbi:MAG: hypothetical protein OXL36_21590 [Bryobacterales bacterium]|nr:hypothetical protein [Bryobacterales bacterium]MDE0293154.1 hypothetical protein [Bryobacterales bacterium]